LKSQKEGAAFQRRLGGLPYGSSPGFGAPDALMTKNRRSGVSQRFCVFSLLSPEWPPSFYMKMGSFISENASASFGSSCVSATTYGRPEDVRVVPIIVPELEFRNIERQIFAADLVVGPDHSSFDERPEALNRIGMDRADNMLADRAGGQLGRPVKKGIERLLRATPPGGRTSA